MKKYLLSLVLSICTTICVFAQTVGVGGQVPSAQVEVLGISTTQSLNLQAMQGRVLLLDFWATWCSPCIGGMTHLDELQNAFSKDKFRVIAISSEKKTRLERFIKNTSHQFTFARANDGLQSIFDYKVIPHAVLINTQGKVVAITSPKNITKKVVQQVLDGKVIDLPLKKDNFTFNFKEDYFKADPKTQSSFVLQPFMKGLPTFSKRYNKGPFKNRRLTAYNLNIPGLYRIAYKMANVRVILEFDEALVAWKNPKNRYCMDVIAQDLDAAYKSAQKQLTASLPIKARIEKRKKTVVVISQQPGGIKVKKAEKKELFSARGDSFNGTGATLENFRNYLEKFGLFGLPVVDETGLKGTYDLQFSFDPENPTSFKEAMNKLGLNYKKQEREIEVLVLSQEK
ncbi:MAG TPA: hypothetical protein DCS93_25315 [Microscillaceae bacterium]|nr:hypothetical protein [Microscillaceae bacterium]